MHPLPNEILKNIIPSEVNKSSSQSPLEAFTSISRQVRNGREGSMGGLGSSMDNKANPAGNLWKSRINEWRNTFIDVFQSWRSSEHVANVTASGGDEFYSITDSSSVRFGFQACGPVVMMSSSTTYFRKLLRNNGAAMIDYNNNEFTERAASETDKNIQQELINLNTMGDSSNHAIRVKDRIHTKSSASGNLAST